MESELTTDGDGVRLAALRAPDSRTLDESLQALGTQGMRAGQQLGYPLSTLAVLLKAHGAACTGHFLQKTRKTSTTEQSYQMLSPNHHLGVSPVSKGRITSSVIRWLLGKNTLRLIHKIETGSIL